MHGLVRQAPRIFALGLVLLLVGFAMAGFSLENLDTRGPYEQKTFESAADVTSVTVDDVNNGITVCPSSDGMLRVTYFERENERYEVDVDDKGALSVRYVSDRKWYEHIEFGISTRDTRVIVYLPEQFTGPIDVKNTNGGIHVENVTATSLSIATANGRVSVERVQASRIDINAGNGSVELRDAQAGEAIEIAGVNGTIRLERVKADRISAHTTNGQIALNTVDAHDAEFRTVNGRIGGDLIGAESDYTIFAKTVNGGNNLTSGGSGARRLSVETVNGGIDIGFNP